MHCGRSNSLCGWGWGTLCGWGEMLCGRSNSQKGATPLLLLVQCKHKGQRLLRDAKLDVWWRLDGSGLAGRQDRVHDIICKTYISDSTVVLSM